jgi:hypothetical protein
VRLEDNCGGGLQPAPSLVARGGLKAAATLLLVVMFLAKPATFWEFDEPLFSQALHHYDPVAHHPPPPGYPVFIFVAQLLRQVIPSDFGTLVTLSFLGSAIGFVMLALAFGRLTDARTGLMAAILFYLSPVMLVHSTLPISEPGALALLATALYFMPVSPAMFGVFAALTIGWRPQFCIFVLPLLFASSFDGQPRAAVLHRSFHRISAFTATCLVWFVPLTIRLGGFEKLIRFETGQAQYLAAHDADASRRGWDALSIAMRFIADSWGPPLVSLPILGLAIAGVVALRRNRAVWPLFVAAIVYLVFALAVMDPADGARYAIPITLVIALAVAVRLRPAFVVAFVVASIMYTSSMLVQRSTEPSPALQAMQRVKANQVVLYELPLWPHATYWLADHPIDRVDDGLRKYFDDPQASLVLYAEGESHPPGAMNFRWAPSAAYAALTRNRYRVASLTPLPPERRYFPVRGVHAPEREEEGDEWRWLDADAEMKLPHPGATSIALRLGLPASAPVAENFVDIYANGALQRRVRIARGSTTPVVLDLPQPATSLRFVSARFFTAARDPRRLAVRLHDLSLRFAPAAEPRARAAG